MLGIIAAITQFTMRTPFPWPAALLPCAGAAMIIYANTSQSTVADRLLSTRSFVGIGLISYSLYLWHWPLLSPLLGTRRSWSRFWRRSSIPPLSAHP